MHVDSVDNRPSLSTCAFTLCALVWTSVVPGVAFCTLYLGASALPCLQQQMQASRLVLLLCVCRCSVWCSTTNACIEVFKADVVQQVIWAVLVPLVFRRFTGAGPMALMLWLDWLFR
jgi:hypothetical protein